MAWRLTGEYDGTPIRLLVAGADHTLGAAPDCDLHLPFPTVSRHHARLSATGEGLQVEDLGSSNGTRIDGTKLSSPVMVAAGGRLHFGEIELEVRDVAAGDDEMGLGLDGDRPATPATAGATLTPAALDRLAFEYLPGVLVSAARGAALPDLARRLGEAYWRALPLTWLRLRDAGSGEPVLFEAGEAPDDGNDMRGRAGGVELAAAFESDRVAPAGRNLFDLAAAVLALAADVEPASGEVSDSPLDLPEPATLDPEVRRIYHRAARVAGSGINVLIQGESGTGKELLARYIHDRADPDAPFVALNCAALPTDLLESELFGIEKGVATGVEARPGCFEAAHGGTLFLDEIGDMAAETQARILRVLQEGEVTRVGGSRARPAKARIISATNRNMERLVGDGDFRLDLLHRVADWEVILPPLRDRPADLPNLALHFLATACRERGIRIRGISRRALDALRNYDWPGNVRELEREMQRVAVFLADGDMLSSDDLRAPIRAGGAVSDDTSLEGQLATAERRILKRALASAGDNVSRAAEQLGVARSTLYRRMAQLRIETGEESA